jgi:hypothetical protein
MGEREIKGEREEGRERERGEKGRERKKEGEGEGKDREKREREGRELPAEMRKKFVRKRYLKVNKYTSNW